MVAIVTVIDIVMAKVIVRAIVTVLVGATTNYNRGSNTKVH